VSASGPSYKPEPNDDIASNVRFAADYYTAKYSNEPVNLIIFVAVYLNIFRSHASL
jgi:hypothetical protein